MFDSEDVRQEARIQQVVEACLMHIHQIEEARMELNNITDEDTRVSHLQHLYEFEIREIARVTEVTRLINIMNETQNVRDHLAAVTRAETIAAVRDFRGVEVILIEQPRNHTEDNELSSSIVRRSLAAAFEAVAISQPDNTERVEYIVTPQIVSRIRASGLGDLTLYDNNNIGAPISLECSLCCRGFRMCELRLPCLHHDADSACCADCLSSLASSNSCPRCRRNIVPNWNNALCLSDVFTVQDGENRATIPADNESSLYSGTIIPSEWSVDRQGHHPDTSEGETSFPNPR
jgi:hypothetical protein